MIFKKCPYQIKERRVRGQYTSELFNRGLFCIGFWRMEVWRGLWAEWGDEGGRGMRVLSPRQ